jgi:signal transduction histidine kinase
VTSVKDSGIGLAGDQLASVFELFAQIENPNARSSTGLGIGLSLARQLVELHGGEIEARSEGLGHGSEFVVRLPAQFEAN